MFRFPANPLRAALLALLAGGFTLCPAPDVGSGAPTDALTQRFVNAYFRNGFNNLVSLPPINDVTRFGSTGLIQEFRDAARTANVRLALIKANVNAPPQEGKPDVVQVLADMYGYYSALGVSTAGYPVDDTQNCPDFAGNSCQYQFFDKNYVLFAYKTATLNGQNFSVRNVFYTKWVALSGLGGLGRPIDVERAVTISSTNATVQLYANGAVYQITSGTMNGLVFAVLTPVYGVYVANGGHDGFLGLPTSDEFTLPGGRRRQAFQGGNIEYDPGTDPVLKLPVASVAIAPSGVLRLKQGDTIELRATTLASNAGILVDRPITWSTTNSRVAALTVSGATATLRAVGVGNALITASSEGKTSPTLNVFVSAPCCQVGEGAPTPVIQQSFQDAVARHRLSVALPAPSPVRRVGSGYIQEFYSTTTPPVRYVLARPDRTSTAYLLSGDLLARYEQLGGFTGPLGYPISDSTAGGRQMFENSTALAGSPVRLVSGAILAKWGAVGFETGTARSPAAESESLLSSFATGGIQQAFTGGVIVGVTTGSRASQAYFVAGRILARYSALAGPTGAFGLPLSDEFGADNRRRQNFEGGYIDYAAGDTTATEHAAERHPAVSAFPASVVAGSRVRLTLSGFPDGATVRVSVTGQPDFRVAVPNGAHFWETFVPLNAPSASITVRGVDLASGASAETTYSVRSLSQSRLQLVKLEGDAQAGAPGALLAQRLRVALRDEAGNPIAGAAVVFTASPGGQVVSSTPATDETGVAEAVVRLPLTEGIALVTAEAMRVLTTFSARVVATQLANYPRFPLQGSSLEVPLGRGSATLVQHGALLAAASSILRYHQNRGELLTSSGPADPVLLNQYLRDLCLFDADGRQVCDGFLAAPDSGEQIVNLWRLAGFVGGQLEVSAELTDLPSIRDLVAQGSPVLLSLALTSGEAAAGGHYVVAIGVGGDGNLLLFDPSVSLGRGSLADYLNGFTAAGRPWKATLAGAARLLPRYPSSSGFLVFAVSHPAGQSLTLDIASPAGSCGRTLDLLDVSTTRLSRFRYCDGSQPVHQLTIGSDAAYRITVADLAQGGRSTEFTGPGLTALRASRAAVNMVVVPQDVSFSSNSVVNAATFVPGIAPGGLIAIFGSGLAASGTATGVEMGGLPARVVSQSPFQVNAEVPAALPPGAHPLRIRSPFGAAEQPVEVRETAPVIFVIGRTGDLPQGAVVNQDGSVNSIFAAARRGQVLQIYCTGLGPVEPAGRLDLVRSPVIALLDGAELPVTFAGLTPGFVGLYQVNALIPAQTPPGLGLPLRLRQGQDSNAVYVSVQ